MNAIDTVKADLKPRLEELLLHLNTTGQIAATAFFTKIFVDTKLLNQSRFNLSTHTAINKYLYYLKEKYLLLVALVRL